MRQQGSLVAPDYLRFDFSHHAQPTREELDEVFALANAAVLTDVGVETTETTREDAEGMGAIAFFGDKYGASVRVVQAGPSSLEFCGGTHVDSLGQIGPITLLSEGSIGSNTRRIFAVTGKASLARAVERERLVQAAAELLRTEPDELVAAIGRVMERQRESEKELSRLRQQSSEAEAGAPAAGAAADGGLVVARRDNVEGDVLRSLAQARAAPRWRAGGRAGRLARRCEGGHRRRHRWRSRRGAAGAHPGSHGRRRRGGSPEVALAGGKDPSQIEAALAEAQRLLSA